MSGFRSQLRDITAHEQKNRNSIFANMWWNKSKPRLSYQENGRSGYIRYRDGAGDITFYFEFGGGDVVAIISVPSPDTWTALTARPLEERNKILEFVAIQSTKDKSPKSNYRISDQWIEIVS